MWQDLEIQLEMLLCEHECVIVPDFGGFVRQQCPAQVSQNRLLAPHTQVVFNAALRSEDGLLTTRYAQQYRLNYRAARERLNRDTQDLLAALHQKKSLTLGRLGTMQEVGEQWVFAPATQAFLPQNLGWLPVLLPAVETKTEDSPVITLHIKKDFLRYAAACAVGLCLLMVSPRGSETSTTDYAALNPVNWAERIAVCQQEEEPVVVERGHFHLVVASLDEASASRLEAQLQAEGYAEACVLPYKQNLNRVVLASYLTKKEALQAMEQTRQNTPYKRAWVFCEKK